MFKSVFAKYISAFMCIIFISFLLLVVIITSMVNNYAVNAKKDQLSNTAESAAAFLEARTDMISTDFKKMIELYCEDVDRMLRSLSGVEDDISILLVDNRGDIVRMIAADGEPGPSDALIPRNVMDEVNNNVRLEEFETLDGVFSTPHFFYTAPVFTEDGYVCGTVFACSSSAIQDELLGVMIKTIIIASLWVMLAAMLPCISSRSASSVP